MWIIVGLGNPGIAYRKSRHNAGFNAIDALSQALHIRVAKRGLSGIYGEGLVNGERVVLVKPQTYMNLSGSCVIEYAEYYKIPPENIIIIVDDTSLERGRIRLRAKGSAGGHNGMKSIIYHLKTDEFPRIRVGIGSASNAGMILTDFVLGRFTKDEIPVLENAMQRASKAVFDIIEHDINYAMK